MGNFAYLGTIICLLITAFSVTSQVEDKLTIINVMADMNLPASPTGDQLHEAMSNIYDLASASSYKTANSDVKSLNWTLFIVNDASLGNRLPLTQLGLDPSIEFGISGNQSDEKISTKSYNEQKAILEMAKEKTEACKICGTNTILVTGFKPQSYDQNEDTYKILDDMGIEYDAGFQAGILYTPGHENDVWPYKVENHKFYAVPVSSSALSGEKVPLDDSYAKNKGLSSSQWYDLLVSKLDAISGKDEPMVVSLSSSISGKGDYLDAWKKFTGYAESKNAKFVKTEELVSMARSGVHDFSAMSIPAELIPPKSSISPVGNQTPKKCATCGDQSSSLKVENQTITVKI